MHIITTFSVVDNMKEQFYAQHGKTSRYDSIFGYAMAVFNWPFFKPSIPGLLLKTGKKIQESKNYLKI